MSAKNPTWLDEYYLVIKNSSCEELRKIFGCDVLHKHEARDWVIWLVNNAELIEEKDWPSGQFDWFVTCYSRETGWVKLILVFTHKPGPGGTKKSVFFDKITRTREPKLEENLVDSDREVG